MPREKVKIVMLKDKYVEGTTQSIFNQYSNESMKQIKIISLTP